MACEYDDDSVGRTPWADEYIRLPATLPEHVHETGLSDVLEKSDLASGVFFALPSFCVSESHGR